MPFMLTFDPENMRIMGHALRIIGISCELWVQFLEFEKAIMGKKIRIIYLTLVSS